MKRNCINEILDLMGRMNLVESNSLNIDEPMDIDDDVEGQDEPVKDMFGSQEVGTPIQKIVKPEKPVDSPQQPIYKPMFINRGDLVSFVQVIEDIHNSFPQGPDMLEPKQFSQLFRQYVGGKKIAFPSSALLTHEIIDTDFADNNVEIPSDGVTQNLHTLTDAYYNQIQNNDNGRFGMVLELLFGKVPDTDSVSDIGRNASEGTELKTKNDEAKSGIIAITQTGIHSLEELNAKDNKIVPGGLASMINDANMYLNEIIVKIMRLSKIATPSRLSFKVNMSKMDNMATNINNGELNLFDDISANDYKTLLNFEILLDNETGSTTLAEIILQAKNELLAYGTPTIVSVIRIVPVYKVPTNNGLDIFDNGREFTGKIDLGFVLEKIHNKCPNLFVSTGKKGKWVDSEISYDATPDNDNYKNDEIQEKLKLKNDVYTYTNGFLYRWDNKSVSLELLVELIRRNFIYLKLKPDISKPRGNNDNIMNNQINGYRIKLTSYLSFDFKKLAYKSNNILTRMFKLVEKV